MKQLFICICSVLLLACCNNNKKNIVSASFADSLIKNYTTPAELKTIQANLNFWKSRINPKNTGLVNELKYAGTLVQRYHLTGNISDLILSDSILYAADKAFNHTQAGPSLMLLRNSILQHKFKTADSILEFVKPLGIKKYQLAISSFDVAFELGNYLLAQSALQSIADYKDYGFNFRQAKLAHYKGNLDTAIAAMHRSAMLAHDDIYLQQAALSNQADLNLHQGNLKNAYELYAQSIRLSAADLHSMMGIGWIALQHDKNDSLAEKIFRFVQTKISAPDPLYKLMAVADERGDSLLQKKFAEAFVQQVTKPAYGNMYNKYLVEVYSGILQQPAKAAELAKKELLNRTTPQTYAWYVWALYCTGDMATAENIYKQHVSGKPLEAVELFWMGKFMKAQNKGYNAQQYFKAANKNRYDLSPSMNKYLNTILEE